MVTVAGVVSVTITVPVYCASCPLLVSYMVILENAEVGVVLEGLITLLTVKSNDVEAARVPPEKVKTAVII